MREYQKYEYCKSTGCAAFNGLTCTKKCVRTARHFHKWLQGNGFKIVKENEPNIARMLDSYEKAYAKMRDAATQSHSQHFDMQGNHGRTCPECVRARSLRDEADEIIEQARRIANG